MKGIVFLTAIGIAFAMTTLTPKMLLTRKITQLVTGFLTDAQISKIVDIAAVDIHNGKRAEEIMSDLYDYLMKELDEVQLKTVTKGYKDMVKDLGEEDAANTMERIKKVVAYAVTPAVEQIRERGTTPDLAYMMMSRQLTPDFVKIVTGLVMDTLTPSEWTSVKAHYGGLLRILSVSSVFEMYTPGTSDGIPAESGDFSENTQQPTTLQPCVVTPSGW